MNNKLNEYKKLNTNVYSYKDKINYMYKNDQKETKKMNNLGNSKFTYPIETNKVISKYRKFLKYSSGYDIFNKDLASISNNLFNNYNKTKDSYISKHSIINNNDNNNKTINKTTNNILSNRSASINKRNLSNNNLLNKLISKYIIKKEKSEDIKTTSLFNSQLQNIKSINVLMDNKLFDNKQEAFSILNNNKMIHSQLNKTLLKSNYKCLEKCIKTVKKQINNIKTYDICSNNYYIKIHPLLNKDTINYTKKIENESNSDSSHNKVLSAANNKMYNINIENFVNDSTEFKAFYVYTNTIMPEAREQHTFSYDYNNNYAYILGGNGAYSINNLWRLSLSMCLCLF